MIGIIDQGMGNILSIRNAFEALGHEVKTCRDAADLRGMQRLVLPGIGAFEDRMAGLTRGGFTAALEDAVWNEGKPILGICLGMHVMADWGTEGGRCRGLGWFGGEVVRLTPADCRLRVPHVGWNEVTFRATSPLFEGVPAGAEFYFVHSYHFRPDVVDGVAAVCHHGGEIVAALQRGHIFATQFHPEKSQAYGLTVLENFARYKS